MRRVLPLLLLSAASWAGLYHLGPGWEKRALKICFASPAPSPFISTPVQYQFNNKNVNVIPWQVGTKQRVRSWLEHEYTSQRTGIHFTDFADCRPGVAVDVVAFLGGAVGPHEWKGQAVASIGPDFGPVPGPTPGRAYVWLREETLAKTTVVHEFGHVARLEHEHKRPESEDDDCPIRWRPSRLLDADEIAFGTYDPESVMNYCHVMPDWPGQILPDVALSHGDMALLRYLYPR